MTRLADGDPRGRRALPANAVDEMGDMAKAVDVFRANAVARQEMEAARARRPSPTATGASPRGPSCARFEADIVASLDVVATAATSSTPPPTR